MTKLSSFPREIVHCIFDYLPCRTILDLAASHHGKDLTFTHESHTQYIDQCILTHLDWRVTFPEFDEFSRIISIWSTWRAIHWSLGIYNPKQLAHCCGYSTDSGTSYILDGSSVLATSDHFSKRQPSGNEIELGLREAIRSVLKKFRNELKILGLYTEEELPRAATRYCTLIRQALLKRQWSGVLDAAFRFNNLRSQQLKRMAQPFELYPSLLEKAADPTQTPRQNFKHIVRRLRTNARWIMEDQSRRLFRRNWQQFRHELFPSVPLNSCLRLFVRTLERYPSMSTQKVKRSLVNTKVAIRKRSADRTAKLENGLLDSTLDSTAKSARTGQICIERVYPPSIVTAIECAKKGMAYVYYKPRKLSLTPAPKVHRTKYTPYSAGRFKTEAFDEAAMFMLPWYPHLAKAYGMDRLWVDTPDRRVLPHSNRISQPYDEREIQWLEAFLMACGFMARLD